MSINPVMRFALKALSYPNLGKKSTYKLERMVKDAASAISNRLAVFNTKDISIKCNDKEILVREYTPSEIVEDDCIILFFHGGGWVTENIDTYNKVCMNMADECARKVISVEYSLAPEKPFPQGVMDCYAVASYLLDNYKEFNLSPNKLILAGDSAGGNLAAVVAMMLRDKGKFLIKRSVLLYPATNNDYSENSEFESVKTNGTDFLLTSKQMMDYMDLYESKPQDRLSPYFAPLLAKSFENLPKTLVVTAEYDPLRDEGEEYAKRLEKAGTNSRYERITNTFHGYMSLDVQRFPKVKETFVLIREFLDEKI